MDVCVEESGFVGGSGRKALSNGTNEAFPIIVLAC